MRVMDATIHISDFLKENIPNSYYIHFPNSGIGNYYCLSKKTGEKIKGWIFTYDDAVKFLEIIGNETIRIPKKNWDNWFALIKEMVEKFENKTGREIVIKKVNDFVQFSRM